MTKLSADLFALCDFALTSQEGKLSLIGLFDRIFVKAIPATYSRFFLVAILRGKANSQHHLSLELLGPSGKSIFKQPTINIKFAAHGKANLITDIASLSLPEIGEYQLVLKSNQKVIARTSFFVTQIASQPSQSN
jgi:hypothetical protein